MTIFLLKPFVSDPGFMVSSYRVTDFNRDIFPGLYEIIQSFFLWDKPIAGFPVAIIILVCSDGNIVI